MPVVPLTCGFIWLGMFPGKLVGPEFRTLCLPIMAAPWSPGKKLGCNKILCRLVAGCGYFRLDQCLPAGPGRPGDPLWVSIGMFGGMLAMFCNLEFIPGIGWLSPAELGPDRTPGLCLFIGREEVERVCPWDIEGLELGMLGLGCPCQPWLGFPGMELLLAPTMLGCPPIPEPPIMFILPMPCFMPGFMPPIIIILGFMFMLFPI